MNEETTDSLIDFLPAFIDIKKNVPFNFFQLEIKKTRTEESKYIANYYCDTAEMNDIHESFLKTKLLQNNVYGKTLNELLIKLIDKLKEEKYI